MANIGLGGEVLDDLPARWYEVKSFAYLSRAWWLAGTILLRFVSIPRAEIIPRPRQWLSVFFPAMPSLSAMVPGPLRPPS
jgi:hypothetical protein